MSESDADLHFRSTLSPRSASNQRSQAAGRSKVALVIGSDIKLTAEIETLLRSRLRIMALITAITATILMLIDFVIGGATAINHPLVRSEVAICAVLAILNLALYLQRVSSLF